MQSYDRTRKFSPWDFEIRQIHSGSCLSLGVCVCVFVYISDSHNMHMIVDFAKNSSHQQVFFLSLIIESLQCRGHCSIYKFQTQNCVCVFVYFFQTGFCRARVRTHTLCFQYVDTYKRTQINRCIINILLC